MKTLRNITFLIAAAILTFSSCMKDQDAYANINYMGVCDTLYFSNPRDTLFCDLIKESMTKMEVTNTIYNEEAKGTGIMDYVIIDCNLAAIKDFSKMTEKLNIADIQNKIFSLHSDSLTKIGYPNASSINLSHFNARFSIWSFFRDVAPLDTCIYREIK